jgi:hypothetical protein
VAISLALGLFNYVDKHREQIVSRRFGSAEGNEETPIDDSEESNGKLL